MSVRTFVDREDPAATEQFDEWRRLNPHGFYASRKGRRWKLHRGWCWHMNTPGTARTAAAPKVCSHDRHAVERHLARLGTTPDECLDCKPYASTVPSRPIDGPCVELPETLSGNALAVASQLPRWADPELGAVEGALRLRLVHDRHRETSLREAKIAAARVAAADGRLRCEVPGCSFDFAAVYGAIGEGYAEVHHLRPLAERDEPRVTTLADLAVVCANCHAMIHRGGECRPLDTLIAPTISVSG